MGIPVLKKFLTTAITLPTPGTKGLVSLAFSGDAKPVGFTADIKEAYHQNERHFIFRPSPMFSVFLAADLLYCDLKTVHVLCMAVSELAFLSSCSVTSSWEASWTLLTYH